MKIAFDLRRINNPGIGRYMKCLVEAILAGAPEHEYLLILPPNAKEAIKFDGRCVETVLSSSTYYSLHEQVELPRLLRRHKADLLHAPHFNIPLVCPCPSVVTIHDVIYLACKPDMPSRLGRLYYRAMITAAVRLADRVITVSEFSRNEMFRYLNADPAKIDVVHSAVDPRIQRVSEAAQIKAVLSRYRIDENYILYTGIYKPRKNHAGLVRAFRELLRGGESAKLVIAGPIGQGEAELRRLANELGIADKIVFTGFVAESDLPSLYSAARVYACPSLYEGFGFTLLEAMTCGVPVVCSANTAVAEVAGRAALYADPQSPHQFAAALRSAFSNDELRRQLIERGHDNCRRFSWQQAASATLDAYERVAGLPVEKAVFA